MEADCFYQDGKFKEALEAFQRMQDVPEKYKEPRLFHAGKAAAKLERWSMSLDYFDALVAQFSSSTHLPEVLFQQGQAFEKLNKKDEARKRYRRLIEEYPKSDAAPQARKRFDALSN